ncbi:SCP-like protein [Ancylostoma ceylanicum]|uniref:SCP-like protein n=1 Tax=Ancylostoma ceylanicum TaxID=53326 RepID=A0A0D6LSW3_9BILA|nr:SCP-like protein [Ancylostoma ceylanicum]
MCPEAADMLKMKYDCTLEASAAAYAKGCSLTNSSVNSRPNEGENHWVALFTGDSTQDVPNAIDAWYSEITRNGLNKQMMYWISLETKPNGPRSFTQMAWANTYKVGCAVALCGTNTFTVCRYSPRIALSESDYSGNIVDEKIYTLGTPCQSCPSTCVAGEDLCETPST